MALCSNNYKCSVYKPNKIKLICEYISELTYKKIDILVYDTLNIDHELYFSKNSTICFGSVPSAFIAKASIPNSFSFMVCSNIGC